MIRSIYWYIVFFVSLLFSFPSLIKVNSLDKKGLIKEKEELVNKVIKKWANKLLKTAKVKVNVHGIENLPLDRTVLFVGNHQGSFDIPVYITSIPILHGFISKIEVEKIPGVSSWMNHMYSVFMDRSSLRKSSEAIIRGIKILKDGHPLVIFPEGTRSKGPNLGEFKAGSFKLATKSKTPIVPITINGSYKVMESNSKSWLINPAIIDFYIHPVVETENLSREEQDNLSEKIKSIIKSKI